MMIKPAHGCTCTACMELRQSTRGKRIAAGFGYAVGGLLSTVIVAVVVLALVVLAKSLWHLL
jgi:hypothetical protein